MFETKLSEDPFALPTALAAAMLVGIVSLGWRMNVVQQLAVPSLTETAQASPLTMPAPTMTRFARAATPATLPASAPAATRLAAAHVATHPSAALIAMQLRSAPTVPPALAAIRPATPARLAPAPRVLTAPAALASVLYPTPPAAMPAARPAPAARIGARARLAQATTPGLLAPPPLRLAALAAPAAHAAMRSVTVRPGQTLWQIAQQTYGRGDAYMTIFRANRGQLSSPAQIRAGQVLRLPARAGRSGTG